MQVSNNKQVGVDLTVRDGSLVAGQRVAQQAAADLTRAVTPTPGAGLTVVKTAGDMDGLLDIPGSSVDSGIPVHAMAAVGQQAGKLTVNVSGLSAEDAAKAQKAITEANLDINDRSPENVAKLDAALKAVGFQGQVEGTEF